MCSLFGMIDYRDVLATREKKKILSVLARECEVRGTDATGIAYNYGSSIHVYKRPLAARKMRFRIPNGVNVVMGHTRMTTQDSITTITCGQRKALHWLTMVCSEMTSFCVKRKSFLTH